MPTPTQSRGISSVLRAALASRLSASDKARIRGALSTIDMLSNSPRVYANRYLRLGQVLAGEPLKLHLGCSAVRLDGYVNIDLRPTSATDLAFDCTRLRPIPSGIVDMVFSNAFLEHFFVGDRETLVSECRRVLKPSGVLMFTGLPDFSGVARAYLERRKPGNVGPVFDLDEAYRYTHGAPEGAPGWWLAQLHKGLIDADWLLRAIQTSGFQSGVVFSYTYKDEANRVTLGCTATSKSQHVASWSPDSIQGLEVPAYAGINWSSVKIERSFAA